MKLSNMNDRWIGTRIRDRVGTKNGTITAHNLIDKTVTIKFDDGELRTIPHHMRPGLPNGAFYLI